MKKNLLLIDDEPAVITLNRIILEKTNLVGSIDSVGNGHEAIHYLERLVINKQPLPNLLFLDIDMPYMSGFEFLKEIRDHLSIDHKNINIILLSSSFNPRDRKKAEAFGIIHFLKKPLSLQEALRVLQ